MLATPPFWIVHHLSHTDVLVNTLGWVGLGLVGAWGGMAWHGMEWHDMRDGTELDFSCGGTVYGTIKISTVDGTIKLEWV
jgi:hypothetical protein